MKNTGGGCLGLIVLVVVIVICSNSGNGNKTASPGLATTAVAKSSSVPIFNPSTPSTMAGPTTIPTPAVIELVVANTGGEGVYIRKSPAMADKVKVWPDGTKMVTMGAEQQAEERKWQNVQDPDGTVGWIPSEYLAAPTPTPRATPIPQGIQAALNDMVALIDMLNRAAGSQFFLRAEIVQGGARLNIYVSDAWYYLPSYEKERFIDTMGDAYALSAAQRGLRGSKPSESNYPQTSFVDRYGKELGYKSTWEVKVYR